MIPVLIIPAVSRFDLLERLLASLDEPVGRLVIVDNSCNGATVSDSRAEYIRPITGLGYPGGINAGILQTPEAPWWFFASVDIMFGPGDLAAIVAEMTDVDWPQLVTGDRHDTRLLRFAYGALNAECVDAVGLMDDGFYPIYFDDDDYERRCRLGDVEWVTYNGNIRHGENGDVGSVTIKSDDEHRRANSRTFPLNAARYVEKWGGMPGSETFTTPYGLAVPLSFTRPDMAGRRARIWGSPPSNP